MNYFRWSGFAILLGIAGVLSDPLHADERSSSAKEAYLDNQERIVFRAGVISKGDVEYIGVDELKLRWEKRYQEAKEEGEKQRWASLLAQIAISKGRTEPDLDSARYWMERAGGGRLALSLRAVVASIANLPGKADSHLRAAQEAKGGLDFAILEQRMEVLKYRMGASFKDEHEFRFWINAWTKARAMQAIGDTDSAMDMIPEILLSAERAR
jgi:hypothetical protein